MDQHERARTRALIATRGFMTFGGCAGQRHDRLIVSHTCGFSDRGWPEIAVSGVPQEHAHIFFTQIFHERWIPPATERPDYVRFDDFLANGSPAILRRLPMLEANTTIFQRCVEFYGREVEAMQLVLPDRLGVFPWERGCEAQTVQLMSPLVAWAVEGREGTARENKYPHAQHAPVNQSRRARPN